MFFLLKENIKEANLKSFQYFELKFPIYIHWNLLILIKFVSYFWKIMYNWQVKSVLTALFVHFVFIKTIKYKKKGIIFRSYFQIYEPFILFNTTRVFP